MNSKLAESLPTNENQPMPKAQGPGPRAGIDPAKNDPAAWAEFLTDNTEQLKQNFDGFSASAKGDKSYINELFDTKEYTAHSPLLREYSQGGHVPLSATLQERVKALTGRR